MYKSILNIRIKMNVNESVNHKRGKRERYFRQLFDFYKRVNVEH